MSIISFGEYIEGSRYKVLDERRMRGSAGIMLLLGLIAFINAFVLRQFTIVPIIAGFLMINFMVGIFINPKFSPTVFISYLFVYLKIIKKPKERPNCMGNACETTN